MNYILVFLAYVAQTILELELQADTSTTIFF